MRGDDMSQMPHGARFGADAQLVAAYLRTHAVTRCPPQKGRPRALRFVKDTHRAPRVRKG
jgi:hypothetical protein